MGKIDDMRKQREAQFEERQKRAKAAAAAAPEAALPEQPKARPKFKAPPPRQLAVGEGRCPTCMKVRALRDGKLVTHRKGLQERCPGSGGLPL